jgi:hypothetical protein
MRARRDCQKDAKTYSHSVNMIGTFPMEQLDTRHFCMFMGTSQSCPERQTAIDEYTLYSSILVRGKAVQDRSRYFNLFHWTFNVPTILSRCTNCTKYRYMY